MPDNPYLIDEKNVPANWVPAPEKGPLSAPAPPVPNAMPPFFSGSMPPSIQHDSKFVGTEVGTPGIPKHSLMPMGTQANPFTNAAATSTAKIIVQQAIAAIPPPPAPAAGVTDGLLHGDAVWEVDPAFFIVRDDFAFASPPGNLGDFTSEFPWHGANGGTGSFNSFIEPGVGATGGMPSFGYISMLNGSGASTGNVLIPKEALASLPQMGWPILDYPGWKLIWIFTISRRQLGALAPAFSWTQVSHYMGLGNWPLSTTELGSGGPARPLDFIGLRYDTDTTAPSIGDTTFKFEKVFQAPTAGAPARNNAQGTVFDTTMVPVEGRSYRLEVSCTTSGSINFFLTDGVTSSSTTMVISKLSIAPSPTVRIDQNIALYGSPGSVALPWNTGSKVTISGGSIAQFNSTFTLMDAGLQPSNGAWLMVGTQAPATDTGATTTLFPALLPFVTFGNDSSAAPVAGSKGIMVDYFGFVWNPGVGGGTGTPNSLKARYW